MNNLKRLDISIINPNPLFHIMEYGVNTRGHSFRLSAIEEWKKVIF